MKEHNTRYCTGHVFLIILLCLSVMVTFNLYTSTYHLNAIFDMSLRFKSNLKSYMFNQSIVTDDLLKHGNVTENIRNSTTNDSSHSPTDSKGLRKDDCINCFVHNFKFLLNNDKICDTKESYSVDIIILIFTIHKNKNERKAIRSTWLTHTKNNTANIRYAFLLGFSKDKKLSESVAEEAAYHGDIIKEDFVDAYVNLTYKTMMAFRWASEYCPKAKFIMKTDDDMWVNVPSLLKSVKNNNSILQKAVGGTCSQSAGPIRSKNSKWYASYESYPRKKYPGFCAGPGYVTSMAVAKQIFEISKHVPFFHLEDVYVSLCIKKLGLKLHRIKGFCNYRVKFDPCLYKSPGVVTSHEVPPALLYQVWSKKCP